MSFAVVGCVLWLGELGRLDVRGEVVWDVGRGMGVEEGYEMRDESLPRKAAMVPLSSVTEGLLPCSAMRGSHGRQATMA